MLKKPRHFLNLSDLSTDETHALLVRASELKVLQRRGEPHPLFPQKVLGMIFEKFSTRTRVSFEAGMAQLGGSALFLSTRDTQLGRGEPIEDTARVVSSMVDIIMVRTYAHDTLQRFAEYSAVPVINALTDFSHPCQLLADMLTIHQSASGISGKTISWIGDGNNMCNSYIEAAALLDFHLNIACPEGYTPDSELLNRHANRVTLFDDPIAACKQVDVITTDTWASMGQEDEKKARQQAFAPYQVDQRMMTNANENALFLHCLPAYRGQEVSAKVIDGPQSVVWEQAENRLHVQKALIEFLLLNR